MSDTMFFGVLEMPYELAMADELSRRQFYARVQEAVARLRESRPEGQAPAAPPSIPRETDAPTKEQALRDLAFIEDIWEMAPDLPYTKRLRLFIEAASAAPPSGVQADDILIRIKRPEGYEDVHAELVVQDLGINQAFEFEVLAAAPPVAPAPAREGWQSVDELWLKIALGLAEDYGDTRVMVSHGRRERHEVTEAHDALRTHLFTAVSAAATLAGE